ncbi:unnamed protein product [Prorocentrum cordatum]|uniref:Uncharacterized protein n=1 Tax=Prorocentrum cordatum TaxID=2364126 RepID=A0ABN9U0Q1_9DINO|nr:unnamed protein product [Polarella glacialis]
MNEVQNMMASLLTSPVPGAAPAAQGGGAARARRRRSEEDQHEEMTTEHSNGSSGTRASRQGGNVLLAGQRLAPPESASAQASARRLQPLNGSMPWFPLEAEGPLGGAEQDVSCQPGGVLPRALAAQSCKESMFDGARLFHASEPARPRELSRLHSPSAGHSAPCSPAMPMPEGAASPQQPSVRAAPPSPLRAQGPLERASLLPLAPAGQARPKGADGRPQPLSHEEVMARIHLVLGGTDAGGHSRGSSSTAGSSLAPAVRLAVPGVQRSASSLVPRLEMQKVIADRDAAAPQHSFHMTPGQSSRSSSGSATSTGAAESAPLDAGAASSEVRRVAGCPEGPWVAADQPRSAASCPDGPQAVAAQPPGAGGGGASAAAKPWLGALRERSCSTSTGSRRGSTTASREATRSAGGSGRRPRSGSAASRGSQQGAPSLLARVFGCLPCCSGLLPRRRPLRPRGGSRRDRFGSEESLASRHTDRRSSATASTP